MNFVIFFRLSYDELEQLNLKAKEQQPKPRRRPTQRSGRATASISPREAHQGRHGSLQRPRKAACTLLDYDKKFLKELDMTFDGSSIRGFTAQRGKRPADGNGLGLI